MKKLITFAAAVCSAAVLWADTPIPNGPAFYDVTLTFDTYPEIGDWGAWPVEMNFLLGPGSSCVGERISVVTNDNGTISLTARMTWDIAAMIAYSKTDAYTGGQSKICTRNYLTQYYNAGGDGGVWTSFNGKYNLSSVESVEGFMAAIAGGFLDNDSHRTMSDPKEDNVTLRSDPKTMLQSMSIKLVRTADTTPCTTGVPVLCSLRVRFNRPLSEMGYDSITKLRVAHGKVFDLVSDSVVLSPDGCEVVGLVKVDVGAISDTVNDPSYRSLESNKGQTRIYLNGSTSDISGGSQIFVSLPVSSSVFDFSEAVKGSIIYRTYNTNRCRVAALELAPKAADGSLFLMRW